MVASFLHRNRRCRFESSAYYGASVSPIPSTLLDCILETMSLVILRVLASYFKFLGTVSYNLTVWSTGMQLRCMKLELEILKEQEKK